MKTNEIVHPETGLTRDQMMFQRRSLWHDLTSISLSKTQRAQKQAEYDKLRRITAHMPTR